MVSEALKDGARLFAMLVLILTIILCMGCLVAGVGAALLLAFTDATSFNPGLHLLTVIGAAVVGVLACATLQRLTC